MALRHLIIVATLASFAPAVAPVMTINKVAAAETVKKKKDQTVNKKKKKVVEKNQEPRVKKNFRGPRPGEPNAGWTDDCLFYYDVYGRLPAYCEPYGHGFRMWDW
ncbi:hypothetical protein G5V57_23400 [Nordella sp. HKS 07]|uniref:hypothetical protein n=1 Tax=Nordella sp. HKS 07 TaxID=2712222 RepID=UPI0013E12C8E|nr:hypothetical protein [Nordella sp. HKS 07]QIG50416.1 hypothetical protein G5V57_23400 [Nordella sp. HKS 07]